MNLGEIYKGINYLISKDVSGYSFTPAEFPLVCNMVLKSLYMDALEAKINLPTAQKQASDIVDISILDQIIKTEILGSVNPTTVFALPADFLQQDSVSDGLYSVELLDSRTFKDSVKSPFFETTRNKAKIEGTQLILAVAKTTVNLTYYRLPLESNFDWVFDVNRVVIYMEPKSFLKTSGSLFDLVRAKTAYANSTAHSVGDRVTYSGLAYEVNTAVLNTNTTPPTSNSSFTSLGNIIIASQVNHVNPDGVNDYMSQSVELDIPAQYEEKFIRKGYEYAMTNLSKNIQQ